MNRDFREEILRQLQNIEAQNNVRILFAIESGSRAWGFASPDSDFDVRFVYAHPVEWYLRVHPQRDVIELPIDADLDINGWELRKALQLMAKCNPTLLEWLDSPIVYSDHQESKAQLRSLAKSFFRPVTCWHHYHSMAKTNYREYLQEDMVKLKKYLYVLRPLLACQWVEAGFGMPPMEFEILVNRLVTQTNLQCAIQNLLEQKKQTAEAGMAPKIQVLNDFIEAELIRHRDVANTLEHGEPADTTLADIFLRETVMKLSG